MPKKIIRRKSSPSRRVTARPLGFWQFIRKNLLIIAGLLLLPVTVGAVVSSYNYANQGSAAGRRNILRTQDRDLNQGRNCVGKCYDNELDECLSSGSGQNSKGCYICTTPITIVASPRSESITAVPWSVLSGNIYTYINCSTSSTVVIPNTSPAPTNPPDSSTRTNYCERRGSNTYCKDGKVRRRSWASYKDCRPDCYTDSGCIEDGVTDVETEETCGGGPVSTAAPTSPPEASSNSCSGPDSSDVCKDKQVGDKILKGYTGNVAQYFCECQRTSGNNCGCKQCADGNGVCTFSAGFDVGKAIRNFFGIFGF